jgi:simple sugar transport system ATP-binding protein
MTDATAPIAVEMRGITKRFPGVIANDNVDLTVRVGEIHALLGENGAGKSTLMSALCGLYQPDEGAIFVRVGDEEEPEQVVISSPRDAIDLGIGMVYQHFKLVPPQTVSENIILGMKGVPFRLDMTEVEEKINKLGEQYHMPVDPQAYVWQLSVGEQQRVEILKLLYRGAEILILDEPTAVLTPQESDELGKTMRQMASEGKAMIFISHKLDEVMAFSDRVTILRDGTNVATLDISDTSKSDCARLMVGREVIFQVDKEEPDLGDLVLELKNVEAENDKGLPALKNLSLQIHGGEILGVSGVAGNGQRELAEVITGLRPVTNGQIYFLGEDLTNQSPLTFINRGVAHVPGDRLGVGLAGNLPVSDNLIMKVYRQQPISSGPFMAKGSITTFAEKIVEKFDVMTPSIETPARNLSGGNQQKAILGREITSGGGSLEDLTPLLVASYPTRGLDVGAIEAVRTSVLEQREQGTAILLISEDLEELMTISDRIAVLHGGEIMGVVKPAEIDIEDLGLMMAGERRQ